MEKERLDQSIFSRGLVSSREKGKALIMAGQVYVNEQRVDKPGTTIKSTDRIEIKSNPFPYVSRGGLKLEKAIQVFQLVIKDKVVLDIGASTGGFTDCAIQNGARKVYAVDVGYGQLDWSLRNNPRVISLERKNARYITREDIPEPVDLITIDVSFISIRKLLPILSTFLKEDGQVIALVKPQFEAGKENVGKKGVVRDSTIHQEVLNEVIKDANLRGYVVKGLDYSPIKGPEGNIEFLLWLGKDQNIDLKNIMQLILETVHAAHGQLDN